MTNSNSALLPFGRSFHLTHLGVSQCLLLPPKPGSLDDDQSLDIQESAPKCRHMDTKAYEDTKRAIISLRNVKAIQGCNWFSNDTVEFAITMVECSCLLQLVRLYLLLTTYSMSPFGKVKKKVDLGCLLSICEGACPMFEVTFHFLKRHQVYIVANIRQLHLW